MRQLSILFILGLLLALILPPRLHAQTATTAPAAANPPADINGQAVNPTPANQAPDEMTKKITDLVHDGKYAEAQQLTAGLLVAYPNDPRLVKARALIEKLLSPAGPASSQPTSNGASAQPAADTSAEHFTGMERIDYNALIELGRQAQQTTDLEQQKASLKQFMDESAVFLQKHPAEMLLWQLRVASALSLNDPMAGYEAGQKLLEMGGADSNDPNLQRLLVQLKNKGWLDKQKMEDERKQQADTAEAARLKAENDKYTFAVARAHGLTSSPGRLTINQNDAVYEGPDNHIRFSKSEVREITAEVPALRFALNDGKSFTFAPDKFYDLHADVLLEKMSLLINAVVERWNFVPVDGNGSLVLNKKRIFKPTPPTEQRGNPQR